ncbi:MAG: FAD binding domain-containing protein [Candidatus Binatia bacterium]
MKAFDYTAPASVNQAQMILSQYAGDAKILGGGTDLIVTLKAGIDSPKMLVSLKNIQELKSMHFDGQVGLVIGAAVTLSQIKDSCLVQDKLPILATAAGSVASYEIRNRATIGGNIALNSRCWYYDQSTYWRKSYPDCRKLGGDTCYIAKAGTSCYALFTADLVPALVALDARVRIAGTQRHETMAISNLYTGTGEPVNVLGPDQIITEITVPYLPRRFTYYRKFQHRPTIDFAMLTLAVSAVKASSHLLEDVKIVLGGVGSGPLRAGEAEKLWQAMVQEGSVDSEQVATVASKETRVFNTFNGSADYKKKVIQVLVGEAVREIMANIA